ncbi:MAG: DHH family phosphoesterase [Candidatus Methanoplasma sp.]|jgi:nanoRNase/pAp phosphatase (c-di-AMP/oligoRNAs hydrolase)|nr:DHH family phosphoesterase [Candidatus Methanoplasma sp.]
MKHKETAERLKDKHKVIFVHGNADMDAVGSAYALSRCFPPADIFAPSGVDRVAGMVAEKLGISVLEECDVDSYDLVVVVDTSSPEQFKPAVAKIPAGSVVIDHHAPTGKWGDVWLLCDETRVSCCEIVYDMMNECGIPPERDVAFALLGGMLTDSGHFQYGDPRMLRSFASVMEKSGIHMDEAIHLTRAPTNMSERVAMLKAVGKSKFERIGDMIVAGSTGGSFEASSCKALMQAGADIAFVGSQRDGEFRVSARASQESVRRGIHLGNMLGELSGETCTEGGGHGGAAGLSGVGDAEAMVHMCMMRTMEEFRRVRPQAGQ